MAGTTSSNRECPSCVMPWARGPTASSFCCVALLRGEGEVPGYRECPGRVAAQHAVVIGGEPSQPTQLDRMVRHERRIEGAAAAVSVRRSVLDLAVRG